MRIKSESDNSDESKSDIAVDSDIFFGVSMFIFGKNAKNAKAATAAIGIETAILRGAPPSCMACDLALDVIFPRGY